MNRKTIEAKAQKFATDIHWNGDDAVTFILELLTEVNMHTVCAKFQTILAEEEERQAAVEVAYQKALADYAIDHGWIGEVAQ